VPYAKIYKESYLGARQDNPTTERIMDKAWSAVKKCLNIERRYEEKIAEIYFYAGIVTRRRAISVKRSKFYNKIFAENISSDDTENYPYLVKAAHRMVKLNWIGIR